MITLRQSVRHMSDWCMDIVDAGCHYEAAFVSIELELSDPVDDVVTWEVYWLIDVFLEEIAEEL